MLVVPRCKLCSLGSAFGEHAPEISLIVSIALGRYPRFTSVLKGGISHAGDDFDRQFEVFGGDGARFVQVGVGCVIAFRHTPSRNALTAAGFAVAHFARRCEEKRRAGPSGSSRVKNAIMVPVPALMIRPGTAPRRPPRRRCRPS